jgi:hypothetical protein
MNGLGVFALKTMIVAGVLSISTFLTVGSLIGLVLNAAGLKGGRHTWTQIEQSIYRFADQPELPPEKKAKIIAALRKIHDKNQPYLDALFAKD